MDANYEPDDSPSVEVCMKTIATDLYKEIRGKRGEKQIVVTYFADDSYYLAPYIKALDNMKTAKQIIDYKISEPKIKEVEYEDESGHNSADLVCYEISCDVDAVPCIKSLKAASLIPEFFLSMDQNNRLILNDEYFICQPQELSPNLYFLKFILGSLKKVIEKRRIESKWNIKLPTSFHMVVRNLKFKDDLQTIFFPRIGASKLTFRNNLTKKDVDRLGIDRDKLFEYLESIDRNEINRNKV